MKISTRTLDALTKKPGEWRSEALEHGHGSVAFRGLKNGSVAGYYRYMDGKKRVTLPIGRYDPEPTSGCTLADLRAKATALSTQHAAGTTAIKEKVEAEAKAVDDTYRKQTEGTFRLLLQAYTSSLRSEGKSSAGDVEKQINKWIIEKHPDLLDKKAGQITHDDVMKIIALPLKEDRTRTVNMLRSYLLAAFNRVIRARGDVTIAAHIGTGYDITVNPVSAVIRVKKFDVDRTKSLTDDELKFYLNAIDELPFLQCTALKLSIMLGGQRPQQLIRLNASDVNLREGTITLIDNKGKRDHPRIHLLPIPAAVRPLLDALITLHGSSTSLFGNLHIDTLSHCVTKLSNGVYQLKDIRRTCETLLASIGIHKDVRAQLLSHGISGIQDKNYDKHTHLAAKANALEAWNAKLNEIREGVNPSNVFQSGIH